MKKSIQILLILIILFYKGALFGKGTVANTKITNEAKIMAENHYSTNYSFATNFVGEIHGIFEVSSNTNFQYGVPGKTNQFWFYVTNRGNIEETNLSITLTNFRTNAGYKTGVWEIGLLDSNSNIIFSTNSASFISYTYKVTNSISIDNYYKFAVFMGVPASVDPNAEADIDVNIELSTNLPIANYSVTNGASTNFYGGFTNINKTCRVVVASPNITLVKGIEKITNVLTGGYQLIPGCEIYYRIFFSNSGTVAGKNLEVVDVLPKNYIEFTNSIVFSNFATNFSKQFSDNNGLTWTYTPVGWDANVEQIRFFSTNTIPVGATGVFKYKVKIR